MTVPRTAVGPAALAALARAQEVLLAPHAFADDVAWRAALAAEARALFGADHALVLLAGAPRPYVGDGFDRGALDAMAAFHAPPGAPGRDDARVRYRDPALERLHARRLAVADPVFTRAGNERAMGRPVEGTAMFDAVCRPLGIADFHGVFARTPHGEAMLFVAHGRRAGRGVGRGTLVGEAAVPLLRVLAPALGAALGLLGPGRGGPTRPDGARPGGAPGAPPLPDAPTLRARFGLTPREADVAHGLARGWTRREIAAAAGMRPATARHHTEAVFRKLGVRTRGAVGLALLGAAPEAPEAPTRG